MKQFRALFLTLTFAVGLRAQLPVPLGTSGNFTVLAGSTVSNTGPTIVFGNVGVFAGTAVVGFPPGIVVNGVIHAGNAVAQQAQADLTVAYVNAAGRPFDANLPGDIGGLSFLPGVYRQSTSLGITGTVTLNGNGNPNAVFIFQIGSGLTTATGNSVVNLINGAQASNVFWQVGSSAVLGTNTIFNGTILAQASITLTTGAVLNGRALARIGAVTLDTNSANNPGPSGAPAGLSLLSCGFPSGVLNQPYNSALVATGGLPPYTYSISVGILPTGLGINATTGAIVGTPTVAGIYNYTARVVDSTAAAATSSCSINISAAAAPLSVNCAPGSNGLVNTSFASGLAALGGVPAYVYSIINGALPPGLHLNSATGAITGTPVTPGVFSYTARVVDSTSAVATNGCFTIITAAALPIPAPSPLILILTAMAIVGLYNTRDRWMKPFHRN